MRSRESGLYSQWITEQVFGNAQYNNQRETDSVNNRYQFDKLSLDKESGPFYLFIIGTGVALIVLIIEFGAKLIENSHVFKNCSTIFSVHRKLLNPRLQVLFTSRIRY